MTAVRSSTSRTPNPMKRHPEPTLSHLSLQTLLIAEPRRMARVNVMVKARKPPRKMLGMPKRAARPIVTNWEESPHSVHIIRNNNSVY